MKTTVWYLLVICLIKVKEMVNYIFALLPDKLGFAPRREVLQQFRDIRQTLATPWQEMCFTIAMVGFVILQYFILRTFPSISLG